MQDRTELFKIFSSNEQEIKEEMNKNPQPPFKTIRTTLTQQQVTLLALTDQIQFIKDSSLLSATVLKTHIQTKILEQTGLSLDNIRDACEQDYQTTLEEINKLETSYQQEIEKIFLEFKSIDKAVRHHVANTLMNKKTQLLKAVRAAARDYRAHFIQQGTEVWKNQFKTFERIFGPIASIETSTSPFNLTFTTLNLSETSLKNLEKFINDMVFATHKEEISLGCFNKYLSPLLDHSLCKLNSQGLLNLPSEEKALTIIKKEDGFEAPFYHINEDLLTCADTHKKALNKAFSELNQRWTNQIKVLKTTPDDCLTTLNHTASTSFNELKHQSKTLKKILIQTARAHEAITLQLKTIFIHRDSIFSAEAKKVDTSQLLIILNKINLDYQDFLISFQKIKSMLASLALNINEAVKIYAGTNFFQLQAKLSAFADAVTLITNKAKSLDIDLQEGNLICEQIDFCAELMTYIRDFQSQKTQHDALYHRINTLELTAQEIQAKAKTFTRYGLIDEALETNAARLFEESKQCWEEYEQTYTRLQAIHHEVTTRENFSKDYSPSLLLKTCQEKIDKVNQQIIKIASAKTTTQARIASIHSVQETLATNKKIVDKKMHVIEEGNRLKALILTTILDHLPQFTASRWGGGKAFTHNGNTYYLAKGVYDILTKVLGSPHPQVWLKAVQQIGKQRLTLNHGPENCCRLSSLPYTLFGVRKEKVEHFYKAIAKYANIDKLAYDNLSREFLKLR